jgi:hypothetical protein
MMPTVDLTAAPYPMSGLPLHRERLRDAIAAMLEQGPSTLAEELSVLINGLDPKIRELIHARTGAL